MQLAVREIRQILDRATGPNGASGNPWQYSMLKGMGEKSEIVLVSKHKGSNWKESFEEVTLAKVDGKVILKEVEGEDDPYKGQTRTSSTASWEISIDDLIKMVKEHGQRQAG